MASLSRRDHPLPARFIILCVVLLFVVSVEALGIHRRVTTSTSISAFKDVIVSTFSRSKPSSSLHFGPPRGGSTKTAMKLSPLVQFDNTPLFQNIAIFSSLNLLGLIVSLVTNSHLHLDLVGTSAFAVAGIVPPFLSFLNGNSTPNRVIISSAAVGVWGVKLAVFLFWRACQLKRDARLEDTLSTFSGTVGFWIVSALWGIFCSLPHSVGTTSSYPGDKYSIFFGTMLYVAGLATESLADYQKWQYKQRNKSHFCDVGLWSVSQHPNWFGNLLLWFGIFVLNASSLVEAGTFKRNSVSGVLWGARRALLALLSPLFLWALFTGEANGTITKAAQVAEDKYGGMKGFDEYKKNVPLIVPNFLRLMFGKEKTS